MSDHNHTKKKKGETMSIDYNQVALEYAQHRRINPVVLEALINQGGIDCYSHVLEAGCGTANYISAIEALTNCHAYGFDPSQEMLTQAKGRSHTLLLQEGKAEKLEYPDESFDLVFSIDVIHHVEDHQAYYSEAYRVLKPGGRICTITESAELIARRKPLAVYFPETVDADVKRYPPISTLRKMMAQAGFISTIEKVLSYPYEKKDIKDYKNKAYSCLHMISEEAFLIGLQRLEEDLKNGPIACLSQYVFLWGQKPALEK
jgi:ubiquinone/menaquinone biosynthesis C-methylase UbiE